MTSAQDAQPPITANAQPFRRGLHAHGLSVRHKRNAGKHSGLAANVTPQADAQHLVFEGSRDQRSTWVMQTLTINVHHLARVVRPGPVQDTLAVPVGFAMPLVPAAEAAAGSTPGSLSEQVGHQGEIDHSASLRITSQISANEPSWRPCILEFPLVAMFVMNHEQIACPPTAFVIGFANFGPPQYRLGLPPETNWLTRLVVLTFLLGGQKKWCGIMLKCNQYHSASNRGAAGLVERIWRNRQGPNPAFLPLRQSPCGTAP